MSALAPDSLGPEVFDQLHPDSVVDIEQIRELLNGWCSDQIVLRRGTNRSADPELAAIESVGLDSVEIRCESFGAVDRFLFLNIEYRNVPYFCSVEVLADRKEPDGPRRISATWPSVVYRAERRDRVRRPVARTSFRLARPENPARSWEVSIVDESGDGIGVELPNQMSASVGERFRMVGRGENRGEIGEIRNIERGETRPGWRRVGLVVLPVEPNPPIATETADEVAESLTRSPLVERARLVASQPNVVGFVNSNDETLVGILDSTSDAGPGSPAILIPSAWGKTKETLVGLSETILSTFEAHGYPVHVLRFDGIRKRGESTNAPECTSPELGNLYYTFTQGSEDLIACARYMRDTVQAGQILPLSFSVASIEARRAVAEAGSELFSAWISVVGATDPQSLIRVISGGVDYLGGAEAGIKFGRQDVQGLLLDIDRTASEALSSRIAFLEDSRRDFTAIDIPVTWIAGADDAWMDPRRLQDVLSFGKQDNRRLIVADTGHQLKSSAEAFSVFGLVASEALRLLGALDGAAPVLPDPQALRVRQRNEQARTKRVAASSPDLQAFWRDYLVGRSNSMGMELVTETEAFKRLMREQIESLDIGSPEEVVLDLGSGISSFAKEVISGSVGPSPFRLVEVDFVKEALGRGRRVAPWPWPRLQVAANLSTSAGLSLIPLRTGSVDHVVASLILNYVSDPHEFLVDVQRVLRANGTMVLSVLRTDADTSRICVEGILELRQGKALESFGGEGEVAADRALGSFVNDAAKLLDLEEQGIFRFWDQGELVDAVAAAGFAISETKSVFGTPPQASLVVANKRA